MISVASRLVFILSLFAGPLAAATQLTAISLATADHDSCLLLELSAPAESSLSLEANRRRLVFHLADTTLVAKLKHPPAGHPLVADILASAEGRGMTLRIDLKKAVSAHAFPARKGLQWVIQLAPKKPMDPAAAIKAASRNAPVRAAAAPVAKAATPSPARQPAQSHERIVVIDAGHGGKDTGAIGPAGTREKDVVLAIARKLEAMIRAEPGMRPVLTRQSDQFIELAQRADMSRREHADLFVSLHADAYINSEARGSSVFTLSEHGASSVAARWLADRENGADLVGGVKLRDKGEVLASVLLDLSQNAAIEDSDHAATRILDELQKGHQLHHREVQKAGFVVLKSPDVPSILVETAFISNPEEEKNLLSGKYQERIARAVFRGIRAYFAGQGHHPPPAPGLEARGASSVLVAQD